MLIKHIELCSFICYVVNGLPKIICDIVLCNLISDLRTVWLTVSLGSLMSVQVVIPIYFMKSSCDNYQLNPELMTNVANRYGIFVISLM